MKIALSADHAGFNQLQQLKDFITELGYTFIDYGPDKLNTHDDYPDFIIPAAKSIVKGECACGIVIGGDGEGEAMAANRIRGIRCAVFYGPAVARGVVDATGRISHDPYEIVRLTRQHNDANMLSLAGRFMSIDDMKNVVKLWLETDFSNDARHVRRNIKLDRV